MNSHETTGRAVNFGSFKIGCVGTLVAYEEFDHLTADGRCGDRVNGNFIDPNRLSFGANGQVEADNKYQSANNGQDRGKR